MLRVPSNIIYRALKDTRLEKLFPELFVRITRKVAVDKRNKKSRLKLQKHSV